MVADGGLIVGLGIVVGGREFDKAGGGATGEEGTTAFEDGGGGDGGF